MLKYLNKKIPSTIAIVIILVLSFLVLEITKSYISLSDENYLKATIMIEKTEVFYEKIGKGENSTSDIIYQEGWPVALNDVIVLGPPVIGDVNKDGTSEVILISNGSFSSKEGEIYILKHNGEVLNNWPIDIGGGVGGILSLGDIDNNGNLEIVATGDDGKTYALSHEGNILPGWPASPLENQRGRPSIFDIDRDYYLDILRETEHYIYAYDKNGNNLPGDWPASISWPPEGMQAIGDIDNNGDLEIIVGASHGGIYAFDHKGNLIDGWPVESGKRFPSPITLADLDQDGDLEIIAVKQGGVLYVYHHDRIKAFDVNTGACFYKEAVPIDLDGDSDLEILIPFETVPGSSEYGLIAFHHNGEIVDGWPVVFYGSPGGGGGSGNGEPSVVVGDIDGDGESEILISARALAEKRFQIYAWHCDGSPVENWPIEVTGDPGNGALALDDLDGDGDIELVFVAYDQSIFQGIYRTTIHAFDLEEIYNPNNMEWPQFHHDFQHTGLYGYDTSKDVLDCNGSLNWTNIEPGSTIFGSFTIENIGTLGSLLDWQIDSWPNWGQWSFDPSNGNHLKPEDGPITIQVSVIAPNEQNQSYSGSVKIINKNKTNNYCTINASLITATSQASKTSIGSEIFNFIRSTYFRIFKSR